MIKCLFRRPKFPLICDLQGVLIGAETPGQFERQIQAMNIPPGEQFPIVDTTGEGWIFHTNYMVISPLTLQKRWTKKQIIDMFNSSSTARQIGMEYPAKSLSSKRLDRVIIEIVGLIRSANKSLKRDAAKNHRAY